MATSSPFMEPWDPVKYDKRMKHAQAQARYRERNLESTREKARQRMENLRNKIRASRKSRQQAAEQRRALDADNREVDRKRKFIAKFGEDAFHEYYMPQHKIQGKNHLPGLALKYAREHACDTATPPPTIRARHRDTAAHRSEAEKSVKKKRKQIH
ncbi:hypothetical protein B0H11DRAFT_2252226 [Mycena galericulata]|nr:hypothetical protein B0H11DRAFT_2252226 [Mycena galericulata]